MKKRIFLLSLLTALFFLLLASCSAKPSDIVISYGEDGKYTGFSDIPEGYTYEAALDDGCVGINTSTVGINEHGVAQRASLADGGESFFEFAERAEKGGDAFVRVAHFIDGTGYYYDLYYCDGKYTIFALNEYGISDGESYSLLRRLEGLAGPPAAQKEDVYYVLTDSTELTYHDVSWSFLSSDSRTVTKIPFKWLGFMIYFE